MDVLKCKRSQFRRLFSKALNDFEKSEFDLSINERILKLRLIEEKAKPMLEMEETYREELIKTENNETIINHEFDESECYIDKWRIAESKLASLLAEKDSSSVVNGSFTQIAVLRYPKLKLPTFDGNIKNWLGYWGQFKKIDTDPNLDYHDKFAYLLQSMEKGSSAEELIKSFPPGGESYSKALHQLQSRFGKEDLLIEVYVRDILSLVLLKNSQPKFSLRKLYDNLESKLRALEVLGVARDKYAAMLYPLVESSLPDDTLRAWQRFRAINRGHRETESSEPNDKKESTHRMDLDDLLSFLLDEIEGEERVSIATKCFTKYQSPKPWNTKHVGFKNREEFTQAPSASTLIATYEKNPNACIFCSLIHESGDCFKARKMSTEERQKAVQNSRSCFLCLEKGHVIAKCKRKTSCVICGKKHHILLCRNIQAGSKSPVSVNIRKDETSQRSYILKSTADEMQFESSCKEKLSHSLFGGTCTDIINHDVFTVFLTKTDGTYHCNFKALGQDVICGSIPPVVEGEWLQELRESNISFSDKNDGPIEILIGADIAGKLMTGGFKLLASGPAAIETKLGWTVFGKNGMREISDNSTLLVTSMLNKEALISDLWSLDALGILDPSEKKNKLELQEEARDHFLSTVKVNEEGRFQVSLRWLDNHLPLKDNHDLAVKRLDSTVKRLKAEKLYDAYGEVFNEWKREGIIEVVPKREIDLPCHYLPHRHVVKENSTTRIRPVFDASAKQKGSPSLNDCLEKGLNLIELIPSILHRFRMNRIGVSADIRKAFLQISLYPKDKDYLRFLWYGTDGKLKYYRHCRVVFGVTSSPFLLVSVIQYLLESTLKELNENPKYKVDIIEQLKKSFYVDNCLASVKNELELQQLIEVASDTLATRKLELRGWEYNDPTDNSSSTTNVLGMVWERCSDYLCLSATNITYDLPGILSKREILATTHKVFDPLGIACPVTLIPKLLLQRLWKLKLFWDQEVDSNSKSEFYKWLNDLKHLERLKIPRWLNYDLETENVSLHFFCDASKLAYSAVAFIRVQTRDYVQVHLLQAKARVAPSGRKETTIARLELLGATICARLASSIIKEFEADNIYFWTDSSTVLAWIQRNEIWDVFVHNRIKEIKQLTAIESWRHVPGAMNPADLPSRGCSASYIIASKWWEGPEWLYLSPEEWPKEDFSADEKEIALEKKKKIVSTLINLNASNLVLTRFSSYRKTIRLVAWICRFVYNCKHQNKKKDELTVSEINEAENLLIRLIQCGSFHGIEDKRIISLNPFIDHGIIRTETAIFQRDDTSEFRTPAILPSDHPLVKSLIMEEHKLKGHIGVSHVLNSLRERFWILVGRRVVSSVLKTCITCKRYSSKNVNPPAPPLPGDRVQDASVFQITGIDYAGPILLREYQKAWICVFTCAVYRCVHLELVTSLTTDTFLQSFHRFVARRGKPSIIYTDNGTNFVGACNALASIDFNEVSRQRADERIIWKFIPPGAPWWGGWWERLIGMMKRVLRKILGRACLNYEEMYTVLCNCEAILNDRPLTVVSADSSLTAITPANFLREIQNNSVPAVKHDFNSNFYKRRLRKCLRGFQEKISPRISRNFENIQEKVCTDGESRRVRLKVQNGEVIRAVQNLYPLELSSTEELPSKFNQNCRCKNISPEQTPVDDAPVKSDGTIPTDIKLPTITKSGRTVRIPRRLDL
ncbi:hypothetical protein AVEN_163254-1 [Araneus ventricosus]|uniref:Integrase catalytic domain-containing protein n=1 Tax=Araneus ventricosus TaxID=182803 RepID=A0A4Y2F468_ARAVE|nr:hypothetical protein AVEN_250697-1 [Araneus ventricosus]GBM36380.1 hypothetical protein AVEN_163254-1 [Araneus ventricosus]